MKKIIMLCVEKGKKCLFMMNCCCQSECVRVLFCCFEFWKWARWWWPLLFSAVWQRSTNGKAFSSFVNFLGPNSSNGNIYCIISLNQYQFLSTFLTQLFFLQHFFFFLFFFQFTWILIALSFNTFKKWGKLINII